MSGLNDDAWGKIFDDFNVLETIRLRGSFEISSMEIKKYREPRLMTKFDSVDALPDIFKEHKLRILPNSRGTYVIGEFKAYAEFTYEDKRPIVVKLPEYVRSFDSFDVTSEAVALNIAQMTGMIDYVMKAMDEVPAVETISGRLSSGSLKYNIDLESSDKTFEFEVENSQVEIDAGFETLDRLAIIEAKSYIPKTFMIRQLYYPYRVYNNLGTDKKVLPIYFTYSDGIYAFHIFKFNKEDNYSSIKKVEQINFIVDESLDLTVDDVINISNQSENIVVKSSFPQADNITRVLDLLNYIDEEIKKSDVIDRYEFHERQGDYYLNALVFIGMVKRIEKGLFALTELGRKVQKMPNSNRRNKIIIEQMLRDKSFDMCFKEFINNGGFISKPVIAEILLKYAYEVGSQSTAERRHSTVKSWIDWIISVTVD
ncbi:hypothetical protein OIT44_04105 [Weissella ceti]|uniref:Translation elongation factor n=1 Tax=Weissella ceti TaxID=759620 RepID=A0ABT3E4C2_9LACO|nr:hypothetical protein [Weissella ceti]MCW0953258.1 hypothetical protein [Weissella ceti]QVK11368.1 hypothetical protein KHQ31_03865 [Weissella ceti]